MPSRLLILALALVAPACGMFGREDDPEPPEPVIVPADLGEMRNVSRADDLWFGGPPCEADLDLAARRGVRAVIDLSLPEEERRCDVARVSQEHGLAYWRVSEGGDPWTDEAVDRVLSILREAGGPALLFCGTGGRCAAFVAIHLVVDEGVPLEEALVEARRAGMKPGEPEAFVRRQVARLTGQGASAPNDAANASEVEPSGAR